MARAEEEPPEPPGTAQLQHPLAPAAEDDAPAQVSISGSPAEAAAIDNHDRAGGSGDAQAPPAERSSPPEDRVITYTEVVLGPEWAGFSASTGAAEQPAAEPPEAAALPQPVTTATVGGTAAGGLSGNTHFIVQQPDNSVDVAIHIERLAELKAAAAAHAAASPPPEAAELAAERRRQAVVVALQGSDHLQFMRRRAIWLWIMVVQFVFYIVLVALCAATSSQFKTANNQVSWGSSELRRNWIRDFAFAFSNSEVECILDMVATLVVTVAAFLGAFLCRRALLSLALVGLFLIFVLGVASVLSPVIVLRLAILILGFQVRAGVTRWHPGPQPPFFTQLSAQTRAACASARLPSRAALAACCCPWRRRRNNQSVRLEEGDVEAAAPGQTSRLDRTSVSLQLGDYIQPAAQARQLVWNRGAGLQRDSAILQNATRARIYVDPQGRRSMRMSTLGSVAGTAAGDQSYR